MLDHHIYIIILSHIIQKKAETEPPIGNKNKVSWKVKTALYNKQTP